MARRELQGVCLLLKSLQRLRAMGGPVAFFRIFRIMSVFFAFVFKDALANSLFFAFFTFFAFFPALGPAPCGLGARPRAEKRAKKAIKAKKQRICKGTLENKGEKT